MVTQAPMEAPIAKSDSVTPLNPLTRHSGPRKPMVNRCTNPAHAAEMETRRAHPYKFACAHHWAFS